MNSVPSSSFSRRPGGLRCARRGWSRACSTIGDGFCGCWASAVAENVISNADLDAGNHVDLNQRVAGNASRGRDGRAHGRLRAEASEKHLVHARVVLEIVQVHVALQN